jgi:phenylalanyl-tRNA synthetase beta chain
MTLQVGTIRGVESRGMLVSEFELQISDDHDGIIDLPAEAPVGTAYAKYAGLDDAVLDINLTPNRPDCTGVNGVARDLAATDLGTFKELTPKPIKGEFPCPVSVKLDFGQTHPLCPAFALRLLRGVKNDPSPEWLQKRLKAIGLRPINALVDITNFITYDRGRPLHVFDAKKVKGNLVVRRAANGEQLLALDGKTYTLDNAMCVIADDNCVESLAGIMGGEASGCDESTTDVLIEVGAVNRSTSRRPGKLGINSDARYRFERGVDPISWCLGSSSPPDGDRAVRRHAVQVTVARKAEAPEKIVDFPTSELKRLAGLDLNLIEMRRVLTSSASSSPARTAA